LQLHATTIKKTDDQQDVMAIRIRGQLKTAEIHIINQMKVAIPISAHQDRKMSEENVDEMFSCCD
jgi:hypothetical protein